MYSVLIALIQATPAAVAEPVARAGQTFLAYPGESVRLNGTASDGDNLQYRWVQIGGPRVPLDDADSARPSFYAEVSGRYTFELTVRAGEATSSPDEIDVVVLDPDVGTRYTGADGCSTLAAGASSVWMAGLASLWGVRRRESST